MYLNYKSDPLRKDRKTIIETTNRQNIIGSMFPFVNEEHPNLIHYNTSTSIWETQKFFIFASSKGGSTITSKLLESLDPTYDTNKKNLENLFFQINEGFVHFNKEYDEIDKSLKELYSALNGKSKKDIIFVTRNPVYKFFSGVIQDVSTDIPTFLPQLMNLDTKGFDIHSDPHSFIDNLFEGRVQMDEEVKTEMMSKIVAAFLKSRYQTRGSCVLGHSKSYNELYNKIIDSSPKIDKTKLWFIDIDNPKHDLVKLFQKYYPEIKLDKDSDRVWTHRPKWDSVFGNLLQYFDNSDYKVILNSIHKEVLNDYYYYKLLQNKYHNNFNLLQ